MIKIAILCLCLLTIFQNRNLSNAESYVNIALYKPTFQSGTLVFPENITTALWSSSHAVDGKKVCPLSPTWDEYSGTSGIETPWWQVDLGKVFTIEKVVVYGRPTEFPHQLKGFRLYITGENLTIETDFAYENTEPYGQGIFHINISSHFQQGRYLTIYLPKNQISARPENGPLVLCEVEIFTPGLPICSPGRYGIGCNQICSNCFKDLCDTLTGRCVYGCRPGYMGNFCSDHAALARISTIHESSTLVYNQNTYSSYHVIDRRTPTTSNNTDTCSCCWISLGNDSNPHIELMLTSTKHLMSMEIIGRLDHKDSANQNLTGLSVLTDGRLVEQSHIQLHDTNNTAFVSLVLEVAKNITITRPKFGIFSEWFFAICEIYLYLDEQQCPQGHFGIGCQEECINCREKACDADGRCISGCQPGYMNEYCNETCVSHYYGNNCSQVCGHCKLNTICHHVNGACAEGCAPGYQPADEMCNTACLPHYYGNNCSQVCGHCKQNTSCYHVNGTCAEGCAPGYQPADNTCHTECAVGTYGLGCVSCSKHCYGGYTQCDRLTGFCKQGCESGYMEKNCTRQCTDGTYGRNCNESCGYCLGDKVCYANNGSCPEGCKPGYRGDICKTECENGKYGINCVHYCHCQNDTACNRSTGECPGQCDIMWTGEKCSENKSFIYSIVKNVVTRQSATYKNNTADKAIDGVDNYPNESCDCCSVASRQNASLLTWWEIDLGQKYLIAAMSIFSRSDGNKEQIGNAEVYAGNQSLAANSSSGSLIFRVPSKIEITKQFHFGTKLDEPTISRFFTVNTHELVLTICEFMLEKTDCPNGSFGNGCLHRCHCKGNKSCDSVTGHCPTKFCEPGWQGDACDTVCGYRTFGDYCNTTCHCVNNTGCDHVYGTCNQLHCEDGWNGSSCSSACKSPSFGFGCNRTCHCFNNTHCNHIDGTCDKNECEPGWNGSSCSNECITPFFGIGCNETCHCINGSFCNHISGICDEHECEPGWNGTSCNEECSARTFGAGCSSECHCIDGSPCHHINGTCERGSCDPGWNGSACYLECPSPSFGPGCKEICHCKNSDCNHISGLCIEALCEPGWNGSSCSQACPSRSFGLGCQETCHCNNSDCDHISGFCYGIICEPGWNGSSCSQSCGDNTFGVNCSSVCHCKEGSCHHINGTCTKSGCATGYQGESCALPITSQESSAIAEVAGGLSAVVFVVAVIVVVGFFLYRRHKSKSADKQGAKTFTHLDEALKQKEQRRAEINALRRVSGNVNSAYTETNLDEDKNVKDDGYAGDGGGYYDFTEVVGIRIHELWDYIQEKKSNECEKLFEEFKKLPSGLIHPCTSADQLANRGKNRYREMYAYDRNRVVLEEKNDKGTDYVNASYIDGYNKTKKFVACQGPTKQMIEDFWRMVWQLQSDKIVMLTNLIEQGATKCTLYWPKEEEFSYGKVNVKIVKLDTELDFDIRHLDVWKEGESPRRIRQYHFKSWPDKDVPDSTWCLVKFWRAVQTDAESEAGPIIVHCSAGVGRTGTFIALDNLVHQGRDEGCVRPFQIVQALREQRVNMVQTKEQYVYLHEVLADTLSFGTHFVWSTQFEAVYMSLLQKDDGETKIRLEVQYDLIKKSLKNTEAKEAEAPEYSNMETIMSESDEYRPKLKKRGSKFVQQLGATFVPNYDGRNTFLVAMSPDKSTIEEFWSLVDDLNIKSVIMLTEKSSTCYKASCDLGAQNDNGGKFHVNKVEEKIRKGYTERSFTFKESHREEENHLMTVKQFEYTAWKDGYVVPGDARSLVDLLDAVLSWQSHISESQPVLIYDGDGYSRSGILCVALNEVQRIKTEGGHINIVQSVKTMKQRKPQLINNFEQYKFCYEIILAYLKHTEVYQNVK